MNRKIKKSKPKAWDMDDNLLILNVFKNILNAHKQHFRQTHAEKSWFICQELDGQIRKLSSKIIQGRLFTPKDLTPSLKYILVTEEWFHGLENLRNKEVIFFIMQDLNKEKMNYVIL